MIKRYLRIPSESFFLFGPRGTGKSMWIKENFKDSLYIDFLDPKEFRVYSAYPERFREIVLANLDKKDILVDEIQKVPQVLSVIHSLIEEKKEFRFILSGSSSRKIKRTGADLLGGRAIPVFMHPFMVFELKDKFSLKKSLNYGLVPLVYFADNPDNILAGYIALYIKEEVQSESLVRNIPAFARFMEAISFSHASILNTSSVARECMVERKNVEGYIKILEDLLLSFQLEVFTKKAKRRLINHRKFYFFDCGVFRSIRPKGPLDKPQEIDGAALEGLVAQNLRTWIDYREKDNKLYYWRTVKGVEVDFVLYGEDGIFAIEVKNSDKIYPENLRPLETFKKDYPDSKLVLLYRGKDRLKKGNVLCIPCDEFLLTLNPFKAIAF